MLYLYLEDTDAAYQRALEAGATSLQEPQDQFTATAPAECRMPSATGGGWLRVSKTCLQRRCGDERRFGRKGVERA
jgi:hypothetical protein